MQVALSGAEANTYRRFFSLAYVSLRFFTILRESASGLGRVKTPMFNLRVEIPSRFRKFVNQKCLRPLLREDDRENNSAHSWLVHVFTQPETRFPRYLRSTPNSDRRTDVVGCFKRAITGSQFDLSITSSARSSPTRHPAL